jgi:hypothetical protein
MRHFRRIVIAVAGGLVLAAGAALIVLPGPGFLVLAAGFAILATEFTWAERMLERTKDRAMQAIEQATSNIVGTVFTIAFAVGMVAVGIVALVEPDLPFASVWSGSGVIFGGIVLLATTTYALRTPGTGHYPPDPELGLLSDLEEREREQS